MQGPIAILRDEDRALNSSSNLRPRDARTDEVVIGGFGQKSKDDAVNMISNIIDCKDGNSNIILIKMSLLLIRLMYYETQNHISRASRTVLNQYFNMLFTIR